MVICTLPSESVVVPVINKILLDFLIFRIWRIAERIKSLSTGGWYSDGKMCDKVK